MPEDTVETLFALTIQAEQSAREFYVFSHAPRAAVVWQGTRANGRHCLAAEYPGSKVDFSGDCDKIPSLRAERYWPVQIRVTAMDGRATREASSGFIRNYH